MSTVTFIKGLSKLGLRTREGQTILRSQTVTVGVSYSLANNELLSIGTILTEAYRDTHNAARLPASFTGSIANNAGVFTLTVTAIGAGTLYVGQTVQGAGILAREPMITAQLTGTAGGTGTYSLNVDKTVASQAMTTDGVIVLPTWANFCKVEAHVTFPTQAAGNGYASVHLFRNSHPTPNGALGGVDMAYHNRVSYVTTNTSYTSVNAFTPKIPVVFSGESWSLPAMQTSGAAQVIGGGNNVGEIWLSVRYFDA